MSNWWAQKLNGGRQQPAQQVPSYPQQGVQPLPQHLTPAGAVQQPVQATQPGYKPQTFSEALAMGDGLVATGLTSVRRTGAGRAGETHHCPECGDSNYFDRGSLGARGNGAGGTIMTAGGSKVHAAPLCFGCGYRGTAIPQQYGELNDALLVDDEMTG
jgi:hypothetical protein